MDTHDVGEVELLLDDASAVEEKIVKVLIKLFGMNGVPNAKAWLFLNLANNDDVLDRLRAIIRNEVDRELNRRKDEYK